MSSIISNVDSTLNTIKSSLSSLKSASDYMNTIKSEMEKLDTFGKKWGASIGRISSVEQKINRLSESIDLLNETIQKEKKKNMMEFITIASLLIILVIICLALYLR